MRKPRKPNNQGQPTSQYAAIARDWAAQPPAAQKRYASEILGNYFRLSRVRNPGQEVRESLAMIRGVLEAYQRLVKPTADNTFVTRLLQTMDQTVWQDSQDLGIRSLADVERLVPLTGGQN